MSLGQQASELQESGLTWRQVGDRLGLSKDGARSAARRWRGTHTKKKENGLVSVSSPDSLREGVFRESRANQETLTSKSRRIKTLEQLLNACEVDLETWRVERYEVNKWEVGIKNADGTAVIVEPLFQVKAKLVRHKLISVFPPVQPVECKAKYKQPPAPKGGIQRALIWADPHFGFRKSLKNAGLEPFHDRQVLDLILQLIEAAKPDRIDILGDILDLPEWSDKFLRSPEFYWTTQPSVLEAHWWLAQMRAAAPGAQIRMHQGNHDKRMEDALMRHLPAAYDLRGATEMTLPPALSVERLLALDALGIEWIGDYPNDASWLNDGVCLGHGDRALSGPGDTAKAVVMSSDVTKLFGHIHRIERASRTVWRKDVPIQIFAACVGCACRIDGAVPGKRSRQQWQNGLAVVDYDSEGYDCEMRQVQIERDRAIFDRQAFTARDRLDDLRSDLPEWGWQ